MTRILTADERQTLNDAMALILENSPKGSSWMICPANYHGSPSCSVTYFDSSDLRSQHSGLWEPDCTFADKIQMAINIEDSLELTSEARRIERINALRAELAKLDEAA